jgi:hypothetical protein
MKLAGQQLAQQTILKDPARADNVIGSMPRRGFLRRLRQRRGQRGVKSVSDLANGTSGDSIIDDTFQQWSVVEIGQRVGND